jgi:hypothetical protein
MTMPVGRAQYVRPGEAAHTVQTAFLDTVGEHS